MLPATFRRLILLACTLAAVFFAGRARAQVFHGVELVHADLLADTTAIAPGKPFTVGLRLKMQPHWHTYWEYSGDAGLPTKIVWQLPAGFQAGPIQWPIPEKIVSPGDIINYGYDDEVVLLTEITPPATLTPGEVALPATAKWLVCADLCVPGSADLTLKLPVSGDAQPANAEIFQKYHALLPVPAAAVVPPLQSLATKLEGNKLTFSFNCPDGGTKPPPAQEFFPLPGADAEIAHPGSVKTFTSGPHWMSLVTVEVTSDLKTADQIGGVLVLTDADGKRRGVEVPPLKTDAASVAAPVTKPTPTSGTKGNGPPVATGATPVAVAPPGSLWHFLLLGFLGGLILNVMPCVLPVISLKLFSFVKQANEAPERVLRLGLAYAAGVFAWFLGFAALVVVLRRAGGSQIGYSFQLQNPWFLLALIAVTFVFSLSLLGVFEVVLPGSVTNAAGEAAARHEGYSGAFLQGVLATVLGSACTAPIFVDALAFAFSQSGLVIVTVFASIAAGMSAPFVLLAAFPRWLRFLPRPGAWMERVKQGTGFLMLATVLWLLWSFGENRRSTDAVVWAGGLLLTLGIACWVQGAFNTLVASDRARWLSRGVIALLLLGGGWFCVDQIVHAEPLSAGSVPFATQLDQAQKTGRLVFVDFTASWCVNCKVNERVVLATAPVQKALQDRQAVFLKADYTAYSEDIARLLHQFNAPSVPLYVIYPAGHPEAPVVLPVVLTQQIVLAGLAEADHRAAPAAGKTVAAR